MFTIGDKVVYPMHGAGVIESIEERVILGETRRYYILNMPYGDMKVMIPLETSDNIGVRDVVSKEELDHMLSVLEEDSSKMSDNWNKRNRDNMEKLKTGDVIEIAEVVRNLIRADQKKKLSTGEKKMLSNAKQLLISEMMMVTGIDPDEAENIIMSAVALE